MTYDPETDPNVIVIVKQSDGNWIGRTQRFGKLIEAREIGPETCLQALLTHG